MRSSDNRYEFHPIRWITLIVLLVLLPVLLFIGLNIAFSVRDYQLNIIVDTQVPFAEVNKFLKSTLIDTDSYGRQFYYCESVFEANYGVFSYYNGGYDVNFYLVVQKRDNLHTYFLEDKCYLYASEQLPEEDCAQFLMENQWNQPIDQTTLAKVKNEHNKDDHCSPYLSDQEKNLIWMEFGIKEVDRYVDKLMLQDGRKMYILREATHDETINGRTYVFLIEDYQVTCKTELTGHPNEWSEQIARFKEMVAGRNHSSSQ